MYESLIGNSLPWVRSACKALAGGDFRAPERSDLQVVSTGRGKSPSDDQAVEFSVRL
jgi:hypothetical protein